MIVHISENINGTYTLSVEQSGDIESRIRELKYSIVSLQIELETYKLIKQKETVDKV